MITWHLRLYRILFQCQKCRKQILGHYAKGISQKDVKHISKYIVASFIFYCNASILKSYHRYLRKSYYMPTQLTNALETNISPTLVVIKCGFLLVVPRQQSDGMDTSSKHHALGVFSMDLLNPHISSVSKRVAMSDIRLVWRVKP